MAEFMQKLKAEQIDVPPAWIGKKVSFFTPKGLPGQEKISVLEPNDHKYLTVDWEVVGRVVRRKARFDERKTEALEEIAQRLKKTDLDKTSSSAPIPVTITKP
jgi:hypothetical protein